MKIIKKTTEFSLSPKTVDAISDEVYRFLEQIGTERKNIIRLRLIVENMLLSWMSHFGENTGITFSTGSSFGKPYINLNLEGEQFDPIEKDDEFGEVSTRLFAGLGLYPTYSYNKNTNKNTVSFKLKKRQSNPVAGLLAAVVTAIIVGLLGMLGPETIRTGCYDLLLTPVYDAFIGVLSTIASPMIFLSVAWGIYGMGDASTLGRIGKKMLVRYVAMTGLITGFTMLVLLPVIKLNFASTSVDTLGVSKIIELVLSIFPKNIVSPFLEGNTMQIILIATVVGCIMLILGNQTKLIATCIEQVNYIIQYLIEIISSIVPVFIFIIVLRLIWSSSLSELYTVWKPLAGFVCVSFLVTFIMMVYVCLIKKANFPGFIKKIFPSFFIALTTASSSAAFGTTVSTCEYDLGVSPKITNFGVPLGMVLYKPTAGINFMVYALFFTQKYNLDVSIAWLLSTFIVVTILTIALPPIPGGAYACYTILFAQLGVPTEALGIVMVMDVFADFISTGLDTVLRQCELVLTADKVDMLNIEKLQRKKKAR